MRPHRLTIFCAILMLSGFSAGAQLHTDYRVPFPKPLKPSVDTVKVFIIGDVMMHTRQLQYDCHSFLKYISPEMKSADIAVANMEFSLGGEPYSGYPAFSAPDYYADYVAECGADVFLIANNHILDCGAKGLTRTIGVYGSMRKAGLIKYTGAAADEREDSLVNPLTLSSKGIKIALVNFTYGTNVKSTASWPAANRMDKGGIATQISRARAEGADFVVALPHWGTEYELHHSATQQEWAEWLVGQGVDAIVGAHPHVVQDTTHISGGPVIYSIGNAVSNMSATNTRCELAVTLRFTIDRDTGVKKMLEPKIEFMWCTLPGNLTDSYATIFIKKWATRRTEWLIPSDYDNMIATRDRVKAATGIVE